MYIHTYTHVCTYIHAYIHTLSIHRYIDSWIHTYMHVCMHSYNTNTCMCTHVYIYICMSVYTHTYICMYVCMHAYIYTYVTGFWKTDQIVTLGLFHFIGPANGYAHTLHIHNAITRLGGLVCFSRTSFADAVNSWLR